ncbi:H-NS family nucleoid-associated regulatory protein [Azohydromonas caseinilytica]|uniref:H-NS histone family protein n=1 Tax=Azohydromonas caseinilytica TaxID=2728836 RepID=A0A848F9G0_9BURK|nr:H-NS family nucleoid-associated regulatory protein [Azohydromonas caseinilytica]NML16787.1 H-NS histone family protein [Azohydromonas caseinilytica]
MSPEESGWIRPEPKPTRESLQARINELREELAGLERQLEEMEADTRLEALVRIRNLMRAFELTPADLGLVAPPRRRGRPPKVRS